MFQPAQNIFRKPRAYYVRHYDAFSSLTLMFQMCRHFDIFFQCVIISHSKVDAKRSPFSQYLHEKQVVTYLGDDEPTAAAKGWLGNQDVESTDRVSVTGKLDEIKALQASHDAPPLR